MFGAEPWSEELRTAIEAVLPIKAVDIYGLSEVIGPGVATECLEQDGLHVNEDHFIVEAVGPSTGDPVEDGTPANSSSPPRPSRHCPCCATGPATSRPSPAANAPAGGPSSG